MLSTLLFNMLPTNLCERFMQSMKLYDLVSLFYLVFTSRVIIPFTAVIDNGP